MLTGDWMNPIGVRATASAVNNARRFLKVTFGTSTIGHESDAGASSVLKHRTEGRSFSVSSDCSVQSDTQATKDQRKQNGNSAATIRLNGKRAINIFISRFNLYAIIFDNGIRQELARHQHCDLACFVYL